MDEEPLDLSNKNRQQPSDFLNASERARRRRRDEASNNLGIMNNSTQDEPLDLSASGPYRATVRADERSRQSPARPRQRQRQASPPVFKSIGRRKRTYKGEQSGAAAKSGRMVDPSDNVQGPHVDEQDQHVDAQGVEPAFEIIQDQSIKKWKTGVEEKTFLVKFHEDRVGERLIDVKDQLVEMFNKVVEQAGRTYSRQDKARMTIFHDSLQSEIFVHLQNLENLTGQSIMDRFERVLNSHEEMELNSSFHVSVGLLRMKRGGGGPSGRRGGARLPLMPHLNNSENSAVVNKKSIVQVVCGPGEEICAAKAVAMLQAKKVEKMRQQAFDTLVKKTRQCTNGPNGLRARALTLLSKCGLPNDRPLTIPELARMEPVIKAKILVITHGGGGPEIIQCDSTSRYDLEFFLYLTSDHFHAVTNPRAMFNNSTICSTCYKLYKHREKNQHPCRQKSQKCFACGRNGCPVVGRVECQDCNITFRSFECYNSHLEKNRVRGRVKGGSQDDHDDHDDNHCQKKSLCELRKKCTNCSKVLYFKNQNFEDHICGTYKCNHCAKWVEKDHLCFLRRRKMQLSSGKFIFFDFESVSDCIFQCRESYLPLRHNGCGTSLVAEGEEEKLCSAGQLCKACRLCRNCRKSYCGRNEHQPNLVVAESCCDSCKNDILKPDSVCKSCGDLCTMCSKRRGKKGGKIDCDDTCQGAGCGKRRVVFKGLDTVFEFCTWLFTPQHRNFTVMAHYGKGYDFMFLLKWLITEAGIMPECIFAGSKLMSLEVKEGLSIRCVDSINFLMMPLRKLPKAFGLTPEQAGLAGADLEQLSKLDFPHAFNTRDRWDYEGPYPPLEMYGVAMKSEEERQRLGEWHRQQEGKIFNLQEQLQYYCMVDTTILRLACMTFRQMIMDITTKEADDGTKTLVDPFSHITMASCVMQIYRLNHIEEFYDITLSDGRCGRAKYKGGEWWLMDGETVASADITEKSFVSSSIAEIPAAGYVRTSNHSTKSIQWLEYESKKLGRQIIHARNQGEHEVMCGHHRYRVDGYDGKPVPGGPKGTVWEFMGCIFHGHKCLEGREKMRDPRTRFTLQELDRQTKDRIEQIKSQGYVVRSIYECEFDKIVTQDTQLKEFISKELDVPQRMDVRAAFFGGRTSGFKLHFKADESQGEEAKYLDVMSLYPFINKHKRLPVGHPRIVTSDFDMTLNSYFGVIHAKVLPPQNDYLGVLPFRARGKLHFPLCRTCCESAQQEICCHNVEERAITGAWCSPELKEAVRSDYRILKIYEVYQYDDSSEYDRQKREGGLFAEQVDLFLKLKAESSGFPQWCRTENDKIKFIRDFEEKTGVTLERDKIEVNPALRSISKLCLNCFWGKLGQRSNMSKSVYISSTETLDKMVCDATIDVTNFHIINEDVLLLEFRKATNFEEESDVTHPILAAFTTAYARLELLNHIRSAGAENILYVDTDSIIFKTRKSVKGNGEIVYENCPEIGDSLGELTNELPEGVHIQEFCCSAPKSYAYRTSDGKESCKFKGVTLHSQNKKRINFESVKELIFGRKACINLKPETQFQRCKLNGIITNVPLVKKITHTFDKRVILENFDTVPYGYRLSN